MSATRHRDALRHRRRPAGRGRRQHLELPRGRADHRPVGLHPERRGDRRLPPGPGRAQRRPERDRRRARAPCTIPRAPAAGAPETLDDSYEQLETLGDRDRARRRRRRRSSPTCRTGSTPPWSRCRPTPQGMRVYHELDPTFYSAASSHVHRQHLRRCSAWRTSPTAPRTPPAATRSCPPSTSSAQAPDLDRAGRHRSAATRARRPSPSGRRSTPCPPCRRAGCSRPTTTSPPAGVRGSPTSPSRSPRPCTADDAGR